MLSAGWFYGGSLAHGRGVLECCAEDGIGIWVSARLVSQLPVLLQAIADKANRNLHGQRVRLTVLGVDGHYVIIRVHAPRSQRVQLRT